MPIDFSGSTSKTPDTRARRVEVVRIRDGAHEVVEDSVAVEEPLEIRLGFELRGRPAQKSISVTMRTPGHDRELAVGFLFGEGMIGSNEDIEAVEYCSLSDEEDRPHEGQQERGQQQEISSNVLRVHLAPHVEVATKSLERHFYTTSSCGVCGKASIEALEVEGCAVVELADFSVSADTISNLPQRLRAAQDVFEETGGLHAAGLFDAAGQLLEVREDVGRHNAMDKLVGSQLLAGTIPLERSVVVLSGRASFELLQKAVMARAPIVVAVGAPSSLAVDLADEFGVTLIGFARGERFNIYTWAERVDLW
jgi:FdhD protein